MSETEKVYYSYKNKSDVYYLTAEEESKLAQIKYEFIQTLTKEQLEQFSKLEMSYSYYKEALIKEIINYSISFHD